MALNKNLMGVYPMMTQDEQRIQGYEHGRIALGVARRAMVEESSITESEQ